MPQLDKKDKKLLNFAEDRDLALFDEIQEANELLEDINDSFKGVNFGALRKLKGIQGDRGPQGVQGVQGLKGDKGDKGDSGLEGVDGLDGIDGINGVDGIDGKDGKTPNHKWKGTKLAFEKPNGKMGKFVDLKGPKGGDGVIQKIFGGSSSSGGKSLGIKVDGALLTTDTQSINFASGFTVTNGPYGINVTSSSSGLENIVEDTTPQLGGDLDAQNNTIDDVQTVQFNSEIDNGSKTTDATITWDNAQKQKVTLTANTITLTLANPTSVGNFLLKVVNGGLATLTWAASTGSVYFPAGTDPSLTSSGTDIVSFYYDGTNFYGVASLDFS